MSPILGVILYQISDLWPANASKIDNKEEMETNLLVYPFI